MASLTTIEKVIDLIQKEMQENVESTNYAPHISMELGFALIEITSEIEPFDWVSWEKGREAMESLSFDKLSQEEHLKLFVGLLRSERFVEGSLRSALLNGKMLAIAKSLHSSASEGSPYTLTFSAK